MRSFIVMAMFVASLASAELNGYLESRSLQLSAEGISVLELDTGAGGLIIRGVNNAHNIQVNAVIRVDAEDDEAAKKYVASNMKLTLVRKRDVARLDASFDRKFWSLNPDSSIDVEVLVPNGMALEVDDGSGSIEIRDVNAGIRIDDGSGSIVVQTVGSISIDDGSGSIDIHAVIGDVLIDDGAGGITVKQIGGSVTIDDGSGSIDVSDVEHDLIIVASGSGGLSVANVRGSVIDDSS
jgi:hypothetical protein